MKAEIEDGFGATLHQLQRQVIRIDLGLSRVLEHFGIDDVTDDGVDAALDGQ